jgi:hypothetical protein
MKQYVMTLINLSVMITQNQKKWDMTVILNTTKQVWMEIKQVKPEELNDVLTSIRDADQQLTQVYKNEEKFSHF